MSGSQRSNALPAWMIGAAYLAMTAAVLYPIIVVNVPNLVDYPNHLARMYILSHINGSDGLRRFCVDSVAAHDLHGDGCGVPWPQSDRAHLIGWESLCRALASFFRSSASPAALCGSSPLERGPIAAFLLNYNYILFYGFLNYLPVLCLALLFFAGWIATADWPRWPRALLFCIPALALYFGHLVAFAAYCLLVGSFEIGRAWRAEFGPVPVVAADGIAAGLQIVPALALGLIVRTDRPFGGPLTTHFGTLAGKATAVVSPGLFMDHRVDVAIGAAAVLVH